MAFEGLKNPLASSRPARVAEPRNPRKLPDRHWLLEVEPWHKSFLANLREFLNPPRRTRVPPRVPGTPLYRALQLELEIRPWHQAFFETARGLVSPKRPEPPLPITSKPVEVADIWETRLYQQQLQRTQSISLAVHATLLLLVAIPFAQRVAPANPALTVNLGPIADISPYELVLPPSNKQAGGGGGGGERNPLPAAKGRLPRQALQQLTPPVAVIRNPHPKLAVEPTIVVPPDIRVPNPNVPQYGDPLAQALELSGGPGSGSGIGTGAGGGVGSGSGPGVGPGWGGGVGGGVFRVGGNVSAPVCLFCPDPEYSEEARKAKYQGLVLIRVVVGADGRIVSQTIRIVKALGMGLDEQAVRTVQQWRFRPASRFGKPVAVLMDVEVNFRLL